jgi:hypothetical protein
MMFSHLGVLNASSSQPSWCTPVITALRRLRQKDQEFKASLGYTDYLPQKKVHFNLQYFYVMDLSACNPVTS